MRIVRFIFVFLFLFCFSHILFAATVENEFSFTLAPGEAFKDWEVNLPFPADGSGKFIGREFRITANDAALDFYVVKEVLSDLNYFALLRMVKSGAINSGNFHVTLYVGTKSPNDIPPAPLMVGWKISNQSEMVWCGFGDYGRKTPVSAKYLYYQLKDEASGILIDEKVVPVYLQGFRFPVKWDLAIAKPYILSTSLANISGRYSRPNVSKITLPK